MIKKLLKQTKLISFLLILATISSIFGILIPNQAIASTYDKTIAYPILIRAETPEQSLGTTINNGKKYYVDIVYKGKNAEIWLRIKPCTCSVGDIKIMDIKAVLTTVKSAGQIICKAKKVYDGGKTIIGCTSSAISGACAVAAVPTGGAAAALCTATFVYTINKGLADCIDGLSGIIASKLKLESEWAIVSYQAAISSGQWGTAIDKAIDIACSNLRAK